MLLKDKNLVNISYEQWLELVDKDSQLKAIYIGKYIIRAEWSALPYFYQNKNNHFKLTISFIASKGYLNICHISWYSSYLEMDKAFDSWFTKLNTLPPSEQKACPLCTGTMLPKTGQYGPFWSCSNALKAGCKAKLNKFGKPTVYTEFLKNINKQKLINEKKKDNEKKASKEGPEHYSTLTFLPEID